MRPDVPSSNLNKHSNELSRRRGRLRFKFAASTSIVCWILVVSGCAGIRHAGMSASERPVQTSNNRSPERPNQEQSSTPRNSIGDHPITMSAESPKIALAGHQELSEGHFDGYAATPDPRVRSTSEAAQVQPEITSGQPRLVQSGVIARASFAPRPRNFQCTPVTHCPISSAGAIWGTANHERGSGSRRSVSPTSTDGY